MRLVRCVAIAVFGLLATNSATIAQDAEQGSDLLLERALHPWKGDFDGIKKRGFLRVAVPHNPLFFAFDGRKRTGLAVDRARALEKHLKEKLKAKITVILMPKSRDQMIPSLVEGRVDMIDANLTVTDDRSEEIAFTNPLRIDVSEIVVTGPEAGDVKSFDDLVEQPLHLRPSSSYFTHLVELNKQREGQGKPPIPVEPADELLEDYDLLEMMHAGMLNATVIDNHKGHLWAQVFDKITLHEDLTLNTGGAVALALRKDAPKLMEVMNGFVKTAKIRTQLGNILNQRYLESTKWVKRATAERHSPRIQEAVKLVKKYSEKFGFDWLLITAQGFQESGLDQSKRSHVGAIGIMQVMPATAKDQNVNIPNISEADPNVHAGVKYMRFLRDQYFDDPAISELDQVLLALAAYNAGPGNIRKSRRQAEKMGLDPNVWFGNVEIATARAVSGEPVIYVRNIFKYAVDIRLSWDIQQQQADAEAATEAQAEEEAKQ